MNSEYAKEEILENSNQVLKQLRTEELNKELARILDVLVNDYFYGFKAKMATLNQFYAPTRYPDAVVGMAPGGMPNKELARRALDYANAFILVHFRFA